MNSSSAAIFGTLTIIMSVSILSARELRSVPVDSQASDFTHPGQFELAAPLSKIVGQGDAIRLRVYPDTTSFIGGTYVVLDNETLFLPVIGQVAIGTMTIQELGDLLNVNYRQFLRFSIIQVEPLIRVSLLGGFLKPGLYYVNPMHSLWNAVSMAGGTVREDGMELLRWERDGKLLSKAIGKDSLESRSLHELGIRSGDRILVTTQLKYTAEDRLTNTIIPIASFIASTVVTSLTAYLAYQTYSGTHK